MRRGLLAPSSSLLARWQALLQRASPSSSPLATSTAAAAAASTRPASSLAATATADPLAASLARKRLTAEAAGTWKSERVITGPQGPRVQVADKDLLLNFCANNYLGLSNHPLVVAAATRALQTHGFGLASVRFICGTTDLHIQLEEKLAQWLGYEACILFPSCFDANAGVFEALLGPQDAVVSDTLNHASIIDGVRLCKARRFRFAHRDVGELEKVLGAIGEGGGGGEAGGGGGGEGGAAPTTTTTTTIVVTDGVFSMDGTVAPLDRIVPIVKKHPGNYLMVDDCHASGFWGATGRGTAEACGLPSADGGAGGGGSASGGVDILSSTLGKALGGATGGFVCAKKDVVAQLRQAARPYLFSNTLAPSVAGASLAVLDLVASEEGDALRAQLRRNALLFREAMEEAGFELGGGGVGGGGGTGAGAPTTAASKTKTPHPIVPVMLGDAALASEFARRMLDEHGVYVVAFSYPVVPKGTARIRVQLSAAHSAEDVERCVQAFKAVGRALGVIGGGRKS
jgi:glycine C-acetyltransferase